MMQSKTNEAPLYDYTIEAIQHTVWLVNKKEETARIQNIFKNIPAIYIADGHHRAASSARLAKARQANTPAHTGKEPYNFFTAALFADDELTIFSYNRMVRNLNELSTDSFMEELKKKLKVTTLNGKVHEPAQKKMLSLYIHKQWYGIDISNMVHTPDPVSTLDVSILSESILSPVLGITDLRNDKRISFIPGIKSADEIEKVVDSGKAAAAFCLYPVSFDELISVANSGREMPPKSTWIEPKLESGLLIYSLEEKR
jgi:uncharacterized protein (DUF1015 family)